MHLRLIRLISEDPPLNLPIVRDSPSDLMKKEQKISCITWKGRKQDDPCEDKVPKDKGGPIGLQGGVHMPYSH